ncbi:glycosyltransferase [Gemella sp. GH3]|uniref:glycosyltransferase n=1 Tax=unclassified Gemella TaxID=2624949 RepID=UPI0015D0017A|nr:MULTISPECIES: glycosyltransferase [unclassified Gemella]MBF0713853.1 glycosyltransferase [Gemella sp. GH3.1]NYS50805.1 glycosyltransferase [Gemella sp. GH3]
MYKVLMLGMSPVLAGTETFIMTYYRNLDKEKFHIDFISRYKEKLVFEDEILENNSKIFYIPPKSKNYLSYKKIIDKFFKDYGKEYDAIWYNVMGLSNIDMLIYAKKYGIKTRIIHSHSSMWLSNSKIKYLLHNINRYLLKNYATHFFGCSEPAIKYLYSDKIIDNSIVIKNAIEIDRFQFSLEDRLKIREKLNWQNNKIIGNIGRFSKQKNQKFLLESFYKASIKDDNLRLIIIGSSKGGESIKEELVDYIEKYNLQNKVKLIDPQYNISSWLSAFDIFVLPSIFEGLPLSALEAQANGLPVLVSDKITKELKIVNNIDYLSIDLEDSSDIWARSFVDSDIKRIDNSEVEQSFNEKGFNIKLEVKKLENILLGNK